MIGWKFSGTCISDGFIGMHSSVIVSGLSSDNVCQNDNGSSPSVKIMIVAWKTKRIKSFLGVVQKCYQYSLSFHLYYDSHKFTTLIPITKTPFMNVFSICTRFRNGKRTQFVIGLLCSSAEDYLNFSPFINSSKFKYIQYVKIRHRTISKKTYCIVVFLPYLFVQFCWSFLP